ncbi:NUDIX hydrolase [Catellatospora sp. KI3]|uniref:NUDIX hydrolase n=1 Tax=Catellatospora sp. KI3 TaxID=3041620 RepID=UPI002482E477|nr:NUDIX hydrolase [Catellatospora sp. KI3]MDI1465604.1 NUDIX hydrolase [Catellatospora sp. KI3]
MTFAGHCFRCGAALAAAPPCVCGACGYEQHLNARPTVGLIILDGAGRFLALRRARAPRAGLWETPGGFCDGWEEPADAARREAREELGVEIELGAFVGMYLGGYEFQGELLPVLDCFFLATLPAGAPLLVDPVEASEYAWFPLADPPPLAFGTMDRALRDAVLLAG